MEAYFEGKMVRILDGQLRFVDFTIPHPHLILMFLVILCQESHYFKDILQFWIEWLYTVNSLWQICANQTPSFLSRISFQFFLTPYGPNIYILLPASVTHSLGNKTIEKKVQGASTLLFLCTISWDFNRKIKDNDIGYHFMLRNEKDLLIN